MTCLVSLTAFLPPATAYLFPLEGYYALSGTFGELRPNHFHTGLDIKTWGKRGLPIKAIQDGYVYRLKVSPYGYGNALYLRHPDGKFSVYGHLDGFREDIEAYIYRRQYTSKQFAQDLYLGRNEFPVRKGEVVAFSGNSGSSVGPHLHFEIREPDERIINPLQFYKHLVADSRPPVVTDLAITPLNFRSRIEGEFDKKVIKPSGGNGTYSIPGITEIEGQVGLEFQGYDLLDAAGNKCGINHVRLYLDDQLIYNYELDIFSFDERRFINLYLDYRDYQAERERRERTYVEDGNKFGAYKFVRERGSIELADDRVHAYRLELEDLHGNRSVVRGKLRRSKPGKSIPANPTLGANDQVEYEIWRNTLILKVTRPSSYLIENGLTYINARGHRKDLPPAYMQGSKLVFLLPLMASDYPQLIIDPSGKVNIQPDLRREILPRQNSVLELKTLKLFFPQNSVFSVTHLPVSILPKIEGGIGPVYEVGDPHQPLFDSYLLSLKPPPGVDPTHLVVARKDGNDWRFAGNSRVENGAVFASLREFGTYTLMRDDEAPEIKPLNFGPGKRVSGQQNLKIKIKDLFSDIDSRSIWATIDGEWVLFKYDAKYGLLTHNLRREPVPAGRHTLEIRVRDNANNLASARFDLIF